MTLPHADSCYQALLSRDSRFDGRFFVGVSSTGIYCRPVCRVRTPRRENCSFYPSAAAAEAAGYRPCLRCCPEHAPGRAPIDSGSRLAHAAAALIEEHLHEGWGMEPLAARLGVSARHLRRIFVEEFGVAPAAYLASRRLLIARELLLGSGLPITEVALAAGFGSVRGFNQRFRACYRLAPGELRQRRAAGPQAAVPRFRLAYRAPFDWPALAGFLRHRAIPGVEAVTGEGDRACYRRIMRVGEEPARLGWVAVTHEPQRCALEVTLDAALLPVASAVLARLRRLFDLGCDPLEVAAVLGPLAAVRPGLRVAGSVDGFEMSVRAILGQQISVVAARTLARRFADRFGTPVASPWPALGLAFPAPQTVAAQPEDALRALGIMGPRARAILALAQALADGRLALDGHAPVEATREALLALPGIGPWTAEYILMRALAWPDAFPEGDVGVHRALALKARAEVRARMAAWRPWRAYAVLQLWTSLENPDGQ